MLVYHFTSSKHGLENIEKRRLKVARILDLNDPFEFIAIKLSLRVVRKERRLLRDKIDSKFGIICFSKSWKQPLMWSHYADAHRGICLGFDISETPNFKKVEYIPNRPYPNPSDDISFETMTYEQLSEMGFVKSNHWQYEEEYRLILKLADLKVDKVNVNCEQKTLYFQPFSPQLKLKKVIVGHRCNLSRETLEKNIGVELGKVELIKARLAFKNFSVVKQKNFALW
ncbi:MAG: hypothetical protein RIR97_237 [Pseudomonadota bacterium]